MEVKQMPTFSKLRPNSIRTVSSQVNFLSKESVRDDFLTWKVEGTLETKNDCPTPVGTRPDSAGERFASLQPHVGKFADHRDSEREALKVDEISSPLASFRTASTELYIPPLHELLHDGCVSSLVHNEHAASSPGKKHSEGKANCRIRPDNEKRRKKRQKSSPSELAAADVEAAIGMIVSAAEAVVVGHLMEGLNVPQILDRSSILEAALGLRKARQLCGLENYDLRTTVNSEQLELLELESQNMDEAYADVGMVLDLVGSKKHVLDVEDVVMVSQGKVDGRERSLVKKALNPEPSLEALREETLKEPPQACEPVNLLPRVSEVETGETVGEVGRQVNGVPQMDKNEEIRTSGDEKRVLFPVVQEVSVSLQFSELPPREMSKRDLDGQIGSRDLKATPQSFEIVAPVSGYVGVEPPGVFSEDHKSSRELYVHDTQILEECDMDGIEVSVLTRGAADEVDEKIVDAPELVPASCLLEEISLPEQVGEPVFSGMEQPAEGCKSVALAFSKHEDKLDENLAQDHTSSQVILEVSPEGNTICVDALVKLGCSAAGIQDKPGDKEGMLRLEAEAEMENAIVSKIAVMDEPLQVTGTGELARIYSQREALAAPQGLLSSPSTDKSPVFLPEFLVENPTTDPFVSRWFGGWTGNVESKRTGNVGEEMVADIQRSFSNNSLDIGSEDAIPQQNAFLHHRSVSFGKKVLSTHKISQGVAKLATVSVNDEFHFKMDETGTAELKDPPFSQACTPGSHLSLIEPLCSFVPSSISPFSDIGYDSADIAASVEACARAALSILDSRKKLDCQQPPRPITDVNCILGNEKSQPRASVSKNMIAGCTVRRRPTSMRKLSTRSSSLSVLLHAVDIAARVLPKDRLVVDAIQLPSSRCIPAIAESPALCESVDAPVPMEVDQTFASPEAPTVVPDATVVYRKKDGHKKQGSTTADDWMCADLSDSPPLVWPRGKKRKLTECGVIESNSLESMPDDVNIATAAMPAVRTHVVEDTSDEHFVQTITQQTCKSILRSTTRSTLSRQCHDPKVLFKGLQFLITSFNTQKKQKLTKCIEQHGGTLLLDIPAFAPKQRFKRRGIDCGARNPPIVIAPHQVRTHKFLYGCAVGSPLLHANWMTASVSAMRCLPYHRYHHKQTRAGCSPQIKDDRGPRSEGPVFLGFQFLFHGQQDFISQFSNLAKHAGGKVIRKLELNGSALKKGPKLVGVIVSEGSCRVPLDLQRAAGQLELHVVDSEWLVVSLLHGKHLPFATKSTTPIVNTSQRSSSSKSRKQGRCSRKSSQHPAGEANVDSGTGLCSRRKPSQNPTGEANVDSGTGLCSKQKPSQNPTGEANDSVTELCSSPKPSHNPAGAANGDNGTRLFSKKNPAGDANGDTGRLFGRLKPAGEAIGDKGIGLFAKKLKCCALPDAKAPKESTARVSLEAKGTEQPQLDTWLGKGFASPPQPPELAEGISDPYSHSLAQKRVPKRFLYYEAFLYNGVEYFLGDIVEVRTLSADSAPSVARIEGLWCEEGRLPQTRAFPQGVRKKAFKNLVLQCRRFYRPSETGFTGRCKNELYLSNDIDIHVLTSDIVRRVRVAVEVAGKVSLGNNWYDDHHRRRAPDCHNGASNAAADEAEYICYFFYDHLRESLHRIKLD